MVQQTDKSPKWKLEADFNLDVINEKPNEDCDIPSSSEITKRKDI